MGKTEDPSDSTKSGVTVQDGVTRGSEESSNTSRCNSEPEVKKSKRGGTSVPFGEKQNQ